MSIKSIISLQEFFKKRSGSEMVVNISKRHRVRPENQVIFPSDVAPNDLIFARVTVQKIFSASFFNICYVDDCINMLRVRMNPYTSKQYDRLRSIHCVSWSNMPAAVFNQIPKMMSEIFLEGPIDDSIEVVQASID